MLNEMICDARRLFLVVFMRKIRIVIGNLGGEAARETVQGGYCITVKVHVCVLR
jgi:hypothetical protein